MLIESGSLRLLECSTAGEGSREEGAEREAARAASMVRLTLAAIAEIAASGSGRLSEAVLRAREEDATGGLQETCVVLLAALWLEVGVHGLQDGNVDEGCVG